MKFKKSNRRGKNNLGLMLILLVVNPVVILAFQNCSVAKQPNVNKVVKPSGTTESKILYEKEPSSQR